MYVCMYVCSICSCFDVNELSRSKVTEVGDILRVPRRRRNPSTASYFISRRSGGLEHFSAGYVSWSHYRS